MKLQEMHYIMSKIDELEEFGNTEKGYTLIEYAAVMEILDNAFNHFSKEE